MNRVFGLDIIRAVAITLVLLCHLSYPLYQFFSGNFETLFNFGVWVSGYFGVEIFFVLSGFLIGSIFYKTIVENRSYYNIKFGLILNFWLRRWFRTLPNYFLFLAVNFIVALIIGSSISNIPIWKFIFFLQKFDPFINYSFYGVSWSLAVEEWFYLILPIFFVLGLVFIRSSKICFLISIIYLFALSYSQKIIYIITAPLVGDHVEAFHFTTLFRLDSIGFGVFLSWCWQNEQFKFFLLRQKYRLLVLGSILFSSSLIFALYFLAKPEQNSITYLAFGPIASLSIILIFPFMIDFKYMAKDSFYKVTMFLSLCSYSLYLCHIPISQLTNFYSSGFVFFETPIGAICKSLFMLVCSMIVSSVLYKKFEMPIMKLRDVFGKPNKSIV